MNVEILKARIVGSLFLYYEFKRKDVAANDTCKISSDAPIHEDLRTAFRNLIPHFAMMTEQVVDVDLFEAAIDRPESYLEDREHCVTDEYFKFQIHEVTIKEAKKDGVEKYQIHGTRLLANFEPLSLSTYEFTLDDTEIKSKTVLAELIDKVKLEVICYMEGKHAPKAQLEMEFENEYKGDDEHDDEGLENQQTNPTKPTAPKRTKKIKETAGADPGGFVAPKEA